MDLVAYPSFAAGEVGPELYGRTDQELYYIGLRTVSNFLIRQYGGASNRPGKKYIAETIDSNKKTRLTDFNFNDQQTYVLAFSDGSMRVLANGGQVVETAVNISAATNNNPGVITTSTNHQLSNGDDVFITGVVGMIELNGREFRVANVTATTFELQDYQGNSIDTTAYGAYVSGGTMARVYTEDTPFAEADLFDLNFAAENDILTVVNNNYYPRDITRTANDAWTVTQFPNSEGPFLDVNITDTNVYSNGTSGSVDLVASDSLFNANMLGELLYIEQEPEDQTNVWEVGLGVRDAEIIKAGPHYYQAGSNSNSVSISGISKASTGVVTTSTDHNLSNDDVIYIDGVVGMLEVNEKYYKVRVVTATTFQLLRTDGVEVSTSSYGTYTSGGTVEQAHLTGTLKPTHVEGSEKDGKPGVTWTYLHSGFGIVQITNVTDSVNATADVVRRLPDNVVGSSNATTNWAKAAWSVEQGYPQAAAYHKERLVFAGTVQQPNGFWMSGTALRTFFGKSNPVLDDESIRGRIRTKGANAIKHLIPFQELIALTSSSEHVIDGVDGVIFATDTLIQERQGETGASTVIPIVVNDVALFVQDIGSTLRTLEYRFDKDRFGGLDMTARSPHLFEGRSIVDMAYQRHPFSVIWCVMSDGDLLGFTFMDEQRVFAWHTHKTEAGAGFYESVACIREGDETATYFVVRRTVNGVTKRYIERMSSRRFLRGNDDPVPIRDAFFVDSGLTYDGRNTGSTTVTISGGTTWAPGDSVTITASDDVFLSTDVMNEVVFWDNDVRYRLQITAYSSATSVTAAPLKDIPAAYQGVAFTNFEIARKVMQPLWHLEGKSVVATVDGYVTRDLTVQDGKVTLDDAGAVVHIGLPYVCDLETLDMARPQGQTKAKPINVNKVFVTAKDSRGFFVTSGKPLPADGTSTGMQAPKARDPNDTYDFPVPADTDLFEVPTQNNFSRKGRIGIRVVDPVPVTINALHPEVHLGSG